MDILLSIIGSAVLTVLLSIAYTAGVCAGKAATHMEEDDELKIYMDHTHGFDLGFYHLHFSANDCRESR